MLSALPVQKIRSYCFHIGTCPVISAYQPPHGMLFIIHLKY